MAKITSPGPVPAVEGLHERITRWHLLKQQVAALTAEEAALRMEIATGVSNLPDKGTKRVPLGYGKDLKPTTKLNYTVDRTALPGLPPELAQAVIKYDPKVNEAGLLAISNPEHKRLLAGVITSKPGLPSLEIVDVKKT